VDICFHSEPDRAAHAEALHGAQNINPVSIMEYQFLEMIYASCFYGYTGFFYTGT
jgi:hypothetical protein